MHLYEEETLQHWLARPNRQINVEENLGIAKQIFLGLSTKKFFFFLLTNEHFLFFPDHIHFNGFVHRDIKPSNIFRTKEGVIKIGDFGLVKDIREEVDGKFSLECSPSQSEHTSNVGTHSYASPEQLNGSVYDFKTDIFSCGLLFFGRISFSCFTNFYQWIF